MMNMKSMTIIAIIFLTATSILFACPHQPPTGQIQVKVGSVITDPTSNINHATATVGETVTFTAVNCFCPDNPNTIAEYQWIFPSQAYCISGGKSPMATCKFSPATAQNEEFTVELRIICSHGKCNSVSIQAKMTIYGITGPWYVRTGGSDANNGRSDSIGGSPDYIGAFKTIQTAIDSAIDNQEICVLEGVYFEQLDFKGKSLNVHSCKADDESKLAPETTIIDANKQGTAVLFRSNETNSCQLKGFTIRNGFPASDGLALHLELDETEGAAAEDVSGKERPGTLNEFNFDGNSGWTTGIYGNALKFDGTNDYVKIQNYSGIAGSDARTVSAWIKTTDTAGGRTIVQWGADSIGQLWMLRTTPSWCPDPENPSQTLEGTITIATYGGGIYSRKKINDGNWHHVAATLAEGETDSRNINLYVDGELSCIKTNGYANINTAVNSPVHIGAWYLTSNSSYVNYSYFMGSIDDVRIYSRALNEAEILEIAGYQWLNPIYLSELDDAQGNKAKAARLSRDGLTIYFSRYIPSLGCDCIVQATRTAPYGSFTQQDVLLELITTPGMGVSSPWISDDGQRLYYHAAVSLSPLETKLKMAEWDSNTPQWIPSVKTFDELHYIGYTEALVSLTSDELNIFWQSTRPGGTGALDIWTASRASTDQQFENITNLSEINTANNDGGPCISPDGLTLYFNCMYRVGGDTGTTSIYKATRASLADPFSNVQTVTFVGSNMMWEHHPYVTADEKSLYFQATDNGGIYFLESTQTSHTVGYWKLDGNANDSSGNTFNGTWYEGSSYSQSGYYDEAAEFSGSNFITTNYAGVSGAQDRTVSAWIKAAPEEPASGLLRTIVAWGGDNTGQAWNLAISYDNSGNYGQCGAIRLAAGNSRVAGSTRVDDNRWHYVTATFTNDGTPDVSEICLYVDGRKEILSHVCPATLNTGSTYTVAIGAMATSNGSVSNHRFNGLIDDVRIYNRAISDSEIQAIYRQRFAAGGGIQGHGTQADITQCIIKQNQSSQNGGGISQINGEISNCLILRNESLSCGGAVADCWADIINCTVVKNKAVSGGGLYACTRTISNNILWDNTIVNNNTPNQLVGCSEVYYSCIQDWSQGGEGNLAYNPSFVNPSVDNYSLQSVSSCIDAGDPYSDYSNEPENNGDRINMGMFGNTVNAEIADRLIDSDDDRLSDYREIILGTDPADSDSDNDNLDDGDEIARGTNPRDKDSDNDGMSDGWEITNDFDPVDILDAQSDSDGDNLTNVEEYLAGTNPINPNSDTDGMSDGWEVANHLDPTQDDGSGDPDNDGASNAAEFAAGTHPFQHNTESMVTEYEYDNQGRIQKQIIHDGQATAIAYATTEYAYDEAGRQWKQRQYKNFGAANNVQEDQITLTAFDVQGNVKMTVRKAENSTNPNSPENGDLVTVNKEYYDFVNAPYWKIQQTIQGTYSSTAADKVAGPKVTEYRYWLLSGQLYQVKAPKHGVNESDRAVTTYEYDNAGRMRKITEATSHYRQMQYDSLGQVIKETAFKSDGTPVRQTRTEYDDLSRVQRQAIMASAAALDSQAINTVLDTVIDYYYDYLSTPIVRDYPGRLIAKTIYHQPVSTVVSATTYFDYDELERELIVSDPDGNRRSVAYDTMGRVTGVAELSINQVDANHNLMLTTWYEFDSSGRLWQKILDEDGDLHKETTDPTTTYKYDAADRKQQEIKPNGVIAEMQYNGWGSLAKQIADAATGGKQQTTVYGFDRLGRQKTITGYTGTGMTGTAQTTTYSYNDLDKVTEILYPDSETIVYSYFDNGMVQTRTDQRGLVTTYAYDTTGRNLLTKTVTQDSVTTVESFTYDAISRMQTANKVQGTDPISASVFAYFDSGKLQSEQQTLFGGTARTVAYAYDPAGYRKQTTYPQGTQLNRTNDWQGRINTLDIAGGNPIVDYAYVGSRVARRSYPLAGSGVNTDFSYDNLGRTQEIRSYPLPSGQDLVHFDYGYTPMEDNIETQTYVHRPQTPSPLNTFGYDNLDRLVAVQYLSNASDTEDFSTMDNLGNRTATVGQRDADHTYSVNALTNRYTAIDSISLAYDDAGNLTIDKDGYHTSYDYENRPVRIYKLSGQTEVTVARFAYDALGRRIKKEDTLDQTKTRYYYYNDNWQVLCEYDLATSSGVYKRLYVWGNYIDEVLLMNVIPAQAGIQDFYYLHDHLYSPAALLDSSGSVVERYEYDAYGTIRFLSPNYEQRTTSSYGNCVAFTGREIDNFDFNAGLPRLTKMHYRHRDYNPFMGRFYQHDPMGINSANAISNIFSPIHQYDDGLNNYNYCTNHPLHYYDPYGLLGKDLWDAFWGKIGDYRDRDKNRFSLIRYYCPTSCKCFCPTSVTANGSTFLNKTAIGARFTVTLKGKWVNWDKSKWSDGRAKFQWWEWFLTAPQYPLDLRAFTYSGMSTSTWNMIQEVKKTLPFLETFSHPDAPGHYAGAVVSSNINQEVWFMWRAIAHPACPCENNKTVASYAHLKYQADYVSKDGVGFDRHKHDLLFETSQKPFSNMPSAPN